jgi:hypothetical protein
VLCLVLLALLRRSLLRRISGAPWQAGGLLYSEWVGVTNPTPSLEPETQQKHPSPLSTALLRRPVFSPSSVPLTFVYYKPTLIAFSCEYSNCSAFDLNIVREQLPDLRDYFQILRLSSDLGTTTKDELVKICPSWGFLSFRSSAMVRIGLMGGICRARLSVMYPYSCSPG